MKTKSKNENNAVRYCFSKRIVSHVFCS